MRGASLSDESFNGDDCRKTYLHSYSVPRMEMIAREYKCSQQSSTGVRSPSLH